MINYRSLNDLNQTIIRGLHKVPRDIDLVVGIPRSGLLAANILALHLNLPLTDLDGLLEGRLIKSGNRLSSDIKDRVAILNGKILIVDDSVATGSTMEAIRKKFEKVSFDGKIIFLAIFINSNTSSFVDLYFEEIKGERIFEWNLMHSWIMADSCVDIDGVLCNDPTDEENDDGTHYKNFILNATPLHLPSVKIRYLVTCRLEKYRRLTEQWLEIHGVQYDSLIMLDLPSKEARQKSNIHASFKAEVYKSTNAKLFIESSYRQAKDISRKAKLPVLCLECQEMIYPHVPAYVVNKIKNNPQSLNIRFKTLVNSTKRRLFHIDPPSKTI